MADPWGPPLKKPTGERPIRVVTKVNTWIDAWNALGTHQFEIDALWHEGKPLYSQENMAVLIAGMDTNQALHQIIDTAGAMKVSNTNFSLIKDYTDALRRTSPGMTFSNLASSSATVKAYAYPVRFQTTLTADGAGEIVAANVGPPTLAGYQSCMVLTHIYSDTTDAGIIFSVAPSAGAFDTGLASMTIATVANTVSPDFNKGLAWLCGTDAATIQFACAAGQAGAAQEVTFCGAYWYET